MNIPCWYCGGIGRSLIIEHQTPKRRGGDNSARNLVLACVSCNVRKGRRTLEEYRDKISTRRGFRMVFYGEVAGALTPTEFREPRTPEEALYRDMLGEQSAIGLVEGWDHA